MLSPFIAWSTFGQKKNPVRALEILQFRRASKLPIIVAILLVVFGFLALAAPLLASLGFIGILGWIFILDAATQIFYSFQAKKTERLVWNLVVSALYVAAGAWLLLHPLLSLVGLTLVLAILFFIEGIIEIVVFVASSNRNETAWKLVDGALTVVIAAMIWRHWPSSSMWALGILVGASMFMTGASRLMMTLAARKDEAGPVHVPAPRAA